MAEDAGSIPAASTNLIMKVAFRNFFRNRAVNLTMKSVRYFLPDAEFYCVSFFKNSESEYDKEEPLYPCIKNTCTQTASVQAAGAPADHVNDRKTSGYGNRMNGLIFSEGYNAIYNLFEGSEEKVLVLAEDHLFTSGVVLKELVENDFDVALAPWDHGFNGSILCMRPAKLSHIFPITDHDGRIEYVLSRNFQEKVPAERQYLIKNRRALNYFGDGFYTNSSEKINQAVEKLYKDGPFDIGSERGINTDIKDKL